MFDVMELVSGECLYKADSHKDGFDWFWDHMETARKQGQKLALVIDGEIKIRME